MNAATAQHFVASDLNMFNLTLKCEAGTEEAAMWLGRIDSTIDQFCITASTDEEIAVAEALCNVYTDARDRLNRQRELFAALNA